MDKYHIYEEIGKGEFSQIFKGREKKQITYVAIKRIDKSMMNKIVNEVQIMHKLDSPHTLRFHDWYETRNNLWLILEYCTGADLCTLLKQDGHLPEQSVRTFGLDILAGLQYMHSLGILHCDLRPKNFLVDEYGILKLSDFKMARKVAKVPLGNTPLNERGIIAYMPPELFLPDGVHSYASDFWALGCLLYELRRGHSPFGNPDLAESILISNIRTLDPVQKPISPENGDEGGKVPSMTTELADMLLWLLEKSAKNRCDWRNLAIHPFWGKHSTIFQNNLPDQIAFDTFIRDTERSKNQKQQQSLMDEFGLTREQVADLIERSDKGPSFDGFKKSGNHKIASSPAARNLQPQISDSTPIRPGVKSEIVEIDNNAPENREKDKVTTNHADGGIALRRKQDMENTNFNRNNNIGKDGNNNGIAVAERAANQYTTPVKNKDTILSGRESNSSSRSKPPSSAIKEGRIASETDLGSALKEKLINFGKDSSVVDMSAESILMHASDSQVKPIVGNKAIEIIERVPFKSQNLSFAVPDSLEMQEYTKSKLEGHLTLVYKALQKATSEAVRNPSSTLDGDRIQMLGYLVSISSVSEVANIVLNTNFVHLILRIVRGQSATATTTSSKGFSSKSESSSNRNHGSSLNNSLRSVATSTLATMLRFATYIQPPLSKHKDDHILPTLISVLKESAKSDNKLKKRATAALGELLFYISSQEDGADVAPDNKWSIPAGTITTLVKCLRDDTDEVVRHYAVKSIENILAQGASEYKRKFVTVDIASRLLELSQFGRNEIMQASCGMALSHMLLFVITLEPTSVKSTSGNSGNGKTSTASSRLRPGSRGKDNTSDGPVTAPGASSRFIAKVFDKGGLPAMLETLNEGQPKLQQAYLNIINLLFCSHSELVEHHRSKTQKNSPFASPIIDENQNNKVNKTTLHESAEETELRPIRQFFLKSVTLCTSILKLIEHGNSTAVRSKALLTAQLLCRFQPSLLVTFTEKRLPFTLVKLIEPRAAGMQQQEKVTSTYPLNAARSFISLVRTSCVSSTEELTKQLGRIIEYDVSNARSGPSSRTGTQLHHQSPSMTVSNRRLSGTVNRRSPSSRSGTPSPTKGAMRGGRGGETETPVFKSIDSAVEVLRACASVAVQPSLRRLILANGPEFVVSLINTLEKLSRARQMVPALSEALQSSTSTKSVDYLNDVLGALHAIDQAILIALEALALVELSLANNSDDDILFAKSMSLLISNIISVFANHEDGGVRVVLVSSLRRMIPSTIKALSNTDSDSDVEGVMMAQCLSNFCQYMNGFLVDQPPIPQYIVRMLSDLMLIDVKNSNEIFADICSNAVTSSLVQLFRDQNDRQKDNRSINSSRDGIADEYDPQLAILIRLIFEKTGAMNLLNNDIAGALYEALQSLIGSLPRQNIKILGPIDISGDLMERLVPTMELLHVILHHVIQSQFEKGNSDDASTNAHRQKYRVLVDSFRNLVPTLLSILMLRNGDPSNADANDWSIRSSGRDPSILPHLHETASRCIGILFDIFPDAVTNFVVQDRPIKCGEVNWGSARQILASCLCDENINVSLRLRLLKVLNGMISISPSLGLEREVKAMLARSPCSNALLQLAESHYAVESRGDEIKSLASSLLQHT